jgi:hypothetical protein
MRTTPTMKHFDFNLERIKESIEGRTYIMPSNLNFTQLKQWMNTMRNLNFIEHTTNTMPRDLAEDTLIVYRTTSTATPESHVHAPIAAGLVNWNDSEQYMGSILEYAVYDASTKFRTNKGSYIDEEYAEKLPVLGFHD